MNRCRGHDQSTQEHGGNQGDGVGLKEVGGHTCAVAYIVSHVVRDHRRISWVVLWDARFDLAHQVSAHISAFGENTTPQSCKNRDEGRTKGQANQWVEEVGEMLFCSQLTAAHQKPKKASNAQQTQANHQHAGDSASFEGNI